MTEAVWWEVFFLFGAIRCFVMLFRLGTHTEVAYCPYLLTVRAVSNMQLAA